MKAVSLLRFFMRCDRPDFSIGYYFVTSQSINTEPNYQREAGVWSTSKQELLIDSIFNGYDIPKIYFHDLRADPGMHLYAVIDGKQRLHAIMRFLNNQLQIPLDFTFTGQAPDGETGERLAGSNFNDLSDIWKEWLKAQKLPIVSVVTDDLEEIEELFSRLNNGEPLNAAEKRNALGGRMNDLIRVISEHDFFTEKVSFNNNRYSYREIAAKCILIEHSVRNGGEPFVDLKKRFLDRLVIDNRDLSDIAYTGLHDQVTSTLNELVGVFDNNDPLLSKQSYPQTYLLFYKQVSKSYRLENLKRKVHTFLQDFHERRMANNQLPDEQRDPTYTVYGQLSMAGTNDKTSLQQRVDILIRLFLVDNPQTRPVERRAFNESERYAIWLRANKMCQECGNSVEFDDMDSDHLQRWIDGGETSFENGRCLHSNCNRAR